MQNSVIEATSIQLCSIKTAYWHIAVLTTKPHLTTAFFKWKNLFSSRPSFILVQFLLIAYSGHLECQYMGFTWLKSVKYDFHAHVAGLLFIVNFTVNAGYLSDGITAQKMLSLIMILQLGTTIRLNL